MYGYVIDVANSFPMAPKKNESVGLTFPPFLLFSNAFFSCSKIVYCSIGLTTSTSAGTTPAKSLDGPSSRIIASKVPRVEGLDLGFDEEEVLRLSGRVSPSDDDDDNEEDFSFFRAVIRVLTTQIGLVMSTVALPASAPAIIDSTVVSLREARPDLRAARSKAARVHSYPFCRCHGV